jgi:hypothetical protein
MTLRPYVFAVASAIVLAGCFGILSFDVQSTGTTTIPGSPAGGLLPAVFNFGSFDISQSAGFNNTDTRKDHITSCRLKQLTLRVTSPASGQDLSFLSRVEFFISAPNLPKVRIAHLDAAPPAGQSATDLAVDDVELQDYAKAASFTVDTQASGTQPKQTTTLEANLRLNIRASPL